jgi:hypothetical protein
VSVSYPVVLKFIVPCNEVFFLRQSPELILKSRCFDRTSSSVSRAHEAVLYYFVLISSSARIVVLFVSSLSQYVLQALELAGTYEVSFCLRLLF